MEKTITIGLNGHPEPYRLEDDAYQALQRYLDRAADRLHDDPDRAEVLGDLERSIGDKLAAMPRSDQHLVTAVDMNAVLDQIGAVDIGDGTSGDTSTAGSAPPGKRRRLRRIRQGQMVAGVCAGLADYAEIRVDWVRTLFVLGSLVTGGILGLVYIALVFILPVDDKP